MREKGDKGFTFAEISIIVFIIVLLIVIAIPNLLRPRISSNDALAKATLKLLSTASESYAASNSGRYPLDMVSLTGATPPYLNKEYCGATVSGFSFTCNFNPINYTFVAKPVVKGVSGTTTFTIRNGGILTP